METPKREASRTARELIVGGGIAALSVLDTDAGKPFVTFVTVAADPSLAPLILISDLAHHARCLKADPRAALMLHGPVNGADPMLTFRVTIQGIFAPCDDDAARGAFLARHPYADMYAGFADFHLWRMEAEHAHIIAGFGRAYGVRFGDIAALSS